MDKIKLINPTVKDELSVMQFRQECFDNGETIIHGDGGLDESNSYKEWLEKINNDSNPETCQKGYVPASVYIAIRESDNKIVGIIQIRHFLNDFLLEHGGHIGYEVRPSERKKGYATQMLGLALKKCLELGIKKVLLTCDKANLGSAKTIQNHHGVLENEITQENGEVSQRYWISLNL